MVHKLQGVLPTATGSEVNRLSRMDGDEINNGDLNQFLSDRGVSYIRRVIQNNIEAGCTLGVTSTFRVTNLRPAQTHNWSMPAADVRLSVQNERWNRQLAQIAQENYRGLPILGNISPLTNTSQSPDDQSFEHVGNAEQRIEFSRRIHNAQIKILADEGVDGILVEACRHPDDALGIAVAAGENRITNLIVSFEAESHGIPDPIQQREGYRFGDVKADVQRAAGTGVNVLIGANCVSASLITELQKRGELLDVAYPNQRDAQRVSSEFIKQLSTIMNEASDDQLRTRIREAIDLNADTPLHELESLWRHSLQARTQIIGICCGGRPHHVKAAREVWDGLNS